MLKKTLNFALIAFFLGIFDLQAQEVKEKTGHFTMTTQLDNFLGFNVAFHGTYPISEKIDFTVLGTLFSSPNLGGKSISATNGGTSATGTGLFALIGAGARFKFAENSFGVNPFVQIANGSMLSGGRYGGSNNQLGQFADGLLPGLILDYKKNKFYTRLLGVYFMPLRKEGPEQLIMSRMTYTAVFQVNKLLALGFLFDNLRVLDRPNTTATYTPVGGQPTALPMPYDNFMFVGASIDFSFTKNSKISFAFGPDLATPAKPAENGGRSFYRIGLTLNL